MKTVDYTLVFCHKDGKIHIGKECSEKDERFIGTITEEIAPVTGYIGNGKQLILNDFSFSTSQDIALAVPEGTEIILAGKVDLTIQSDQPDANVSVLYGFGDMTLSAEKNGSLTICADTSAGLWSRGICARGGNLTVFGGVYRINCGYSKKSCCLYAGGHLFLEVGEKGRIDLLGGDFTLSSKSNAVRSAEGKLTLAEGAIVQNAMECRGKEKWVGDCLTQRDASTPMRIRF